jgi:cytochrome P450 family 150 subfamily A5
MTDWQELDFFKDPGLVADPYPYLAAARERCPVWREPHHDVVMVTGYDEATEVFQDAVTFSSCISVTGPFPDFPVPLGGDDVSELIERYRDTLPFSDQLPALDPPVHTDHRALLMRLITPKRLKENEASMWRLADSLLDGFLADGRPATGEFISGFATPFTLLVIADLLGLPEEDQRDLVAAMHAGQRSGGGGGDTRQRAMAHNPLEGLYQRFTGYIEDRRREPGGDVLSALAGATFPDGSLPEVADVVRIAANLFSAGQETTVRLLGSALKMLAEDPDMQRRLREDRDRIPGFIEETLRTESPVTDRQAPAATGTSPRSSCGAWPSCTWSSGEGHGRRRPLPRPRRLLLAVPRGVRADRRRIQRGAAARGPRPAPRDGPQGPGQLPGTRDLRGG